MVKFAKEEVKKTLKGLELFRSNVNVDMQTGRITSANVLIAKVDLDKGDTKESVKEWILSDENTDVVNSAYKKYENASAKRRASIKERANKRKQIKVELKEQLLREQVKNSLTKNKKK